ncbi:MAG: ACR3 family arsenite efflux transporter [Culicoidibacterales bacterium]
MADTNVEQQSGISFFEKYLTIWVLGCMLVGILIGRFIPQIPAVLQQFEYAQVSIPIAMLIWIMIYPMMMKVDFASLKDVGKAPKGLLVSSITSWGIKPFLMFGLAYFFFNIAFSQFIEPKLAAQYIAGAVLLGAAPCTAMVFVWSNLVSGSPAYTLVQVAVNDLLILVLFIPIVSFLLGATNIFVPWDTLFLSIFLFVVVPLIAGIVTRKWVVKIKGKAYFETEFVAKFGNLTMVGLLLTLLIIFSFQGDAILSNPFHVILISVPLILQNVLTFLFAYGSCKMLRLPYQVAAPAGLIGASDFFELAVAVAITLFGPLSPVVLVTTVGVLTEVPVMLWLVSVVRKTKSWFPN